MYKVRIVYTLVKYVTNINMERVVIFVLKWNKFLRYSFWMNFLLFLYK